MAVIPSRVPTALMNGLLSYQKAARCAVGERRPRRKGSARTGIILGEPRNASAMHDGVTKAHPAGTGGVCTQCLLAL